MMKNLNRWCLLIALIFNTASLCAQSSSPQNLNANTMNTYLIERDIQGAGDWSGQQLKDVSQASCQIVNEMGPGIKWVHSYVTDDKIFCIYQAENEGVIRAHAEKGGFPINSIHKLATMISPQTAEE